MGYVVKSRGMSHVTYPTTLMQFEEYQIKQVLENCDKTFTLENVMLSVEIWNKKHAVSVFKIIKDLFQDVKDNIAESSSDSESEDEMPADNVLWNDIINDMSFLSLLDTSDWDAGSSCNSFSETDVDNMPENAHVTCSVPVTGNNIIEQQSM